MKTKSTLILSSFFFLVNFTLNTHWSDNYQLNCSLGQAIGRSQSTLLLVSAVILIIIGIAIAILGIIGFSKQIAG